jgi:proteasome lid subunit RPN8/RPN11
MELWNSNLVDCWFGKFAETVIGTPVWNLYAPEPVFEPSNCQRADTVISHTAGVGSEASLENCATLKNVSTGKPKVTALCQQLARSDLDAHLLIEPHQYGVEGDAGEGKVQPFNIVVHPQVWLVTDVHSHLCDAEVIGLLAGRWDASLKCIYVQNAFPCSSTERPDDDGSTDVELDPSAELLVREIINQIGLQVVGWYHSHPKFRPDPSITDIFNQAQYQRLMRNEESGDEPFVGLIVSSYDGSLPTHAAFHQWFHVVPFIHETSRMKKEVYIPLLLETRIVSLATNRELANTGTNEAVDGSDSITSFVGSEGNRGSLLDKLMSTVAEDLKTTKDNGNQTASDEVSPLDDERKRALSSISHIQAATRQVLCHKDCGVGQCIAGDEPSDSFCRPVNRRAPPPKTQDGSDDGNAASIIGRSSAGAGPDFNDDNDDSHSQKRVCGEGRGLDEDNETETTDRGCNGDDDVASIELDTFNMELEDEGDFDEDNMHLEFSDVVAMGFSAKGGPKYLEVDGEESSEKSSEESSEESSEHSSDDDEELRQTEASDSASDSEISNGTRLTRPSVSVAPDDGHDNGGGDGTNILISTPEAVINPESILTANVTTTDTFNRVKPSSTGLLSVITNNMRLRNRKPTASKSIQELEAEHNLRESSRRARAPTGNVKETHGRERALNKVLIHTKGERSSTRASMKRKLYSDEEFSDPKLEYVDTRKKCAAKPTKAVKPTTVPLLKVSGLKASKDVREDNKGSERGHKGIASKEYSSTQRKHTNKNGGEGIARLDPSPSAKAVRPITSSQRKSKMDAVPVSAISGRIKIDNDSNNSKISKSSKPSAIPKKSEKPNRQLEFAPGGTISLLQLLKSEGTACGIARQMICQAQYNLQFPMLLLVLVVFYYSSHPRRVDFNKKFRDSLRCRKAADSAKEALRMFGLSFEKADEWAKMFTAFLLCCWEESPREPRRKPHKPISATAEDDDKDITSSGSVNYIRREVSEV